MSSQPRVLVVDLETTALDERRGSILQIGACWLMSEPEDPELQEFEIDCRAYDGAEIDVEALEVNGCSEARVWNPSLPTESEAIELFLAWLWKCCGVGSTIILAGLNPSFDLRWLNAARKRAGEAGKSPFPHRTIDLHTLAISYAIAAEKEIPAKGFVTDDIYRLLDLPPEPRPHVAIQGARAESEALRILLGLPNMFDTYSVQP
jgi:DNA polymerase III epsilon subunit-like protein